MSGAVMANKTIIGMNIALKEMRSLNTNATVRNFLMETRIIGKKAKVLNALGQLMIRIFQTG